MSEQVSKFSPEEAAAMATFGLDVTNFRDVKEWEATAPSSDEVVCDYTLDRFEIGAPTDSSSSSGLETPKTTTAEGLLRLCQIAESIATERAINL